MSLSYIMARMQLLSGTTEDWTTGDKKDFIIMPNELAVEWDTESDGYYSGFIGIKIGDGQSTFENLSYISNLDATTVKVGGESVKEFDADTKVSKLGKSGNGAYRVYINQPDGTVKGFTLQTSVNTSAPDCIPRFVNANFPDDNSILSGYLTTNTPNRNTHAANKKYVDDTVAAMGDTKYDKLAVNNSYDTVPFIPFGKDYLSYKVLAGSPNAIYSNRIASYMSSTSTHAVPSYGWLVTATPLQEGDCANKKYVDDNFIAKSGDGTIDGSLTVAGDLVVQGTTHTQDNETLRIVDNIIEINSEKADNTTVLSGVAINKNSDSTYGVMYDPTDDTVKFGEGQTENGEFSFKNGEGAPLAIRDDSSNIADGAIMIFDKSKNKLVDSGYTIDGFKQWVRDYIESYMSEQTIIDNNGNQTLSVTGKETVIENPDGNQTLIIGG